MANIINVTVDDTTQTVNVSVQDGVLTASGGGTFIDGFLVKKGTGNVAGTIEVGDYITGWIGDTALMGKVASIPVLTSANLTPAVVGEAV